MAHNPLPDILNNVSKVIDAASETDKAKQNMYLDIQKEQMKKKAEFDLYKQMSGEADGNQPSVGQNQGMQQPKQQAPSGGMDVIKFMNTPRPQFDNGKISFGTPDDKSVFAFMDKARKASKAGDTNTTWTEQNEQEYQGLHNKIFDIKTPKGGGILTQLGIDTEGKMPEQIRDELQKKNPVLAEYLRKVGHNKIPVKGSMGMGANQVNEVVSGLYPDTYDPSKFPAYEKMRASYTSGPISVKLASLNTSLMHLDRLYDNFMMLDNKTWRGYNSLANYVKNQANDPILGAVGADISAVSGELASTFKASGATDTEIRNFQQSLSITDSPERAKKVLDEFVHLIGGRSTPIFEQWKKGAGDLEDFPVIGDSGLEILKKHGFDYDKSKGTIKSTMPDNGSPTDDGWLKQGKYQYKRGE
jgi:hypothetical protein